MTGILIVAETRLYSEGLAQVLDRDPTLEVLGTAASAAEALTRTRDLRPEVVLLDLGRAGLPLMRPLAREVPTVRVVVVSLSESDSDVLAWAEAGVAGYLSKDDSLDDLRRAIAGVARGEIPCSPRIVSALLRRVAEAGQSSSRRPDSCLTPREREIVALIDEGLSNKEIARRLSIRLATVKNHVHNVLEKLRVGGRGEAAAFVRRGEPTWAREPEPDARDLDPLIRLP
jgi:two-component system nitrate/nitrite response regulator NarL